MNTNKSSFIIYEIIIIIFSLLTINYGGWLLIIPNYIYLNIIKDKYNQTPKIFMKIILLIYIPIILYTIYNYH